MERLNATKNGWVSRVIPVGGAVTLFALSVALMPVAGIGLGTVLMLGGVSALTVSEFVFTKLCRTKLDMFFEDAGIEKNGKPPAVVKKTEIDGGYVYKIRMPAGLSTEDLERLKPSLEQYLNAGITIAYDSGYSVITANEKRLKRYYGYEIIQTDNPLEVCIGYDVNGPLLFNLESAPHVLIAGATGAGKSVLLRSIITSLILMKKADLHLVDFQRVELGIFRKSERVKTFCSEPLEFAKLLAELKKESDRRLALFDKANVVNIDGYNKKAKTKLQYMVVVIDEFATLGERQYKGILDALKVRIAQDRKCGIHYIICTQRPSVDIVQGTIKANIPVRIALKTSTDTDSRVILDESGAENLRGAGHGILKTTTCKEFQAMFLSETEARSLIQHTITEKKEVKPRDITATRPPRAKIY
jgi:S-DNA-T family DNA segregation ATPase FtsK/SpoIIIE